MHYVTNKLYAPLVCVCTGGAQEPAVEDVYGGGSCTHGRGAAAYWPCFYEQKMTVIRAMLAVDCNECPGNIPTRLSPWGTPVPALNLFAISSYSNLKLPVSTPLK